MIEDNDVNTSVDNTSVDNTSVDTEELNSEETTDVSSNDTVNSDSTDSGSDSVADGDDQPDGAGLSTKPVSTDNSNNDSEQQRNTQANFKALRQAKKQAEKERDELALQIKAFNLSRKNEVARTSDTEEDDVYEDDMSKTRRELKDLQNKIYAQENQVKAKSIEVKLKTEFPDLEAVVNEDNIDTLKARDPNFAKIINRAPSDPDELYHRAVAAYTLIKKYGIYVKDDHVKDRARVEKNMAKPRPAQSRTSTPSEGLADFADFVGMDDQERSKAILKLAKERANS